MLEKADKIKISVIIPVYNNEKTIDRCISSVIRQTLKGIEIIVVDDESEDHTYDIIQKYEREYDNIRSVRRSHVGQGMCRNIGLEMSRGEYIGFVDGDDEISEMMYETLYNHIGDADICQCNAWVIRGDIQHKAELRRFNGEVDVVDRLKYANEFFFNYIHGHGCCNKIFRKSFVNKHNIRFADNNIVYSEDLYFNILTLKHLNKIVFVDEMLYYYYQYETSHSHEISIDKAKKICTLFDMVTHDEFCHVFARLGVINICMILAKIDGEFDEILLSDKFTRLLKLAVGAPEPFYQKVIIFLLLKFRKTIGMWLIKHYYGRFNEMKEYK